MSYSKILAIFLIFSILQSCSKGEIDPITGKKKRYGEMEQWKNPEKRKKARV